MLDEAALVKVLEAGKYESQQAAVWETGDWTGNGFFDTNDFVTALIAGCYEQGPVRRPVAVPELSSAFLAGFGLLGLVIWRRQRSA